ncbi:MAG TPA: GTPase Era [Smithella sp.]|jgi:GTP-binding protein Era|nr:GTPase Era [Smithella sp.]HOG10004.1 GTPase Era [Smithella sp.]HOO34524.1 GTPase Era [Smithella sp.]HOS14425.1 GTPase Era [Smithella sp.]HPK22126.1 GTPase Era [Smithella sp.]
MFKSGFIGIIGRPNAGKSTLFNAIIGDKISIMTHKPQTTRNKITGIKNYPDAQLIFLDTPGMHKPKTPLNRAMVRTTREAIGSVDVLLMMIEAQTDVQPHDLFLIESLNETKAPVLLVINKIDLIEKKFLLPLMDKFRRIYDFREIVPISALHGNGVEELLTIVKEMLPEGPKYYPDDIVTDATERFIASEFIREKITLHTKQELPYSAAVEIDLFKEDEAKNLIRITATINVEKDSQKAIMIGKKGAMLKKIGTQARLDMENLFGAKVYLELFVRVRKEWTASERMLEEFGLLKH